MARGDVPLLACWLGRIGHAAASALQERQRRALLDAGHEPPAAELILLLEHDPVVTLGRAFRDAHLLAAPATFDARGIELARVSRGGSATWHGPGQLIVYPVVKVGLRVRAHVQKLCLAAASVLADLGIEARYSNERPGLWVGPGAGPRKIAAVGVHVQRGVAIHGLALNVDPDFTAYSLIVPCGQAGTAQTSVERELGAAPPLEMLGRAVASAFATLRERPIAFITRETLSDGILEAPCLLEGAG